MNSDRALTRLLVGWASVLVAAYLGAIICFPQLTQEDRSSIATLLAFVGLIPPAIYAYWPRSAK